MAQTIERLKISIPEYYKRTPEDLFNNELSINNRLYLLALSAGKFASSSLLFHDPQGVMDSFATKPHVDTPNHNGYFDPVVVGSVYEHLNKGKPRPYYVMLAEPFQNRLGAYVGGHLGGIPLDRKAAELGDGGVTMKMMRMTRYALKVARTPVVVFPSGTFEDRRSDSELGRGA